MADTESPIDDERVAALAERARLALDPAERKALRVELTGLLERLRALQEVDTTDVEPLAVLVDEPALPAADEAQPFPAPERLLELAAETRDGYFVVPRILDEADGGPADGQDAADPDEAADPAGAGSAATREPSADDRPGRDPAGDAPAGDEHAAGGEPA